ncbi:hypothetical protein CH251_12640 [Rhodococcus sp. 06-462-5]|uniref:DUF3556 domain-containing protein n=1 Tax=Nocardiaceae TaxID=85025 RepID=UPI00068D4ED8|nr:MULTISPECIES: DUF3556 domain-containing protein [Rhodococcus]OZC73972.1 hypothetical protein CH251_12640 [Rhodococcus sp. 06-462-5]OZE67968.1 hypothetical protein CH270_09600 [Rhodococcus sp. 02-925g]OZF52011.1 hypothetical protein CH291_05380 [Rhodococcus sp. 14-1411-2a]
MGLKTGDFPPVDPATFLATPYQERIKILSRHWVDYGFGTPKITALTYIARLFFPFMIGGIVLNSLTSGISPLDVGQWWNEPIFYQKAILWILLLESIGYGGSWGPLSGHFEPKTGGFRYWAKPRTIRLAPWPGKVPFTSGDERTVFDTLLYMVYIAVLAVALVLPGVSSSSLDSVVGADNHGLVAPGLAIAVGVLLVLNGLRDKVIFVGARGEQYLPALVFFGFFPFVDMIVAAKILIVSVWVGAGVSKLGHHVSMVIPPMMSNTPWLTSIRVKRMNYRNFPDDLRPSRLGTSVAHVGGTLVEIVTPFVLLFSTNMTSTVIAIGVMLLFHLVITSTFPLATPLEWNVLFMYLTVFLFAGFPAGGGFAVSDMHGGLLALTLVGLLFFPVLGNLRPDLVSFLPSMRQYAGNWATGFWAMAPGAEAKLNEHIVKSAPMTYDQLSATYGPEVSEVVLHQILGWRSLHSQGRGLNSVMIKTLGDDINHYTLREAEFSCNAVVAFNFGDGHLHSPQLIEAIQKRCNFAPGEFVVVWIESEPIFGGRQQYLVVDAAIGIVERGSYAVRDAIVEQPWLPNGPIATEVHWHLHGYERISHPKVASANPAATGVADPDIVNSTDAVDA